MNLLHKEDSPYLKQHENNPVHWNSWGEEALNRAKKEKKPIFVSIGYSTCHWCHVMEREVFEKEEFAKTLNENFISIKIDKEERPDIDKYYQEVYQIMNKKAGGWPLSMFLTHEGKPFFAGTYIPPTPKHGMIGFNELLHLILEKYDSNYDDIIQSSETLTSMMSGKQASSEKTFDGKVVEKINHYLRESYDKVDGGFSSAPKFPHHDTLLFLIEFNREKDLNSMCEETLKKMAYGGLYDIVEGGFCRYSVDDEWLVPHFEKMLYDNGLLSEVYAKGYFKFNNEFFKRIAVENVEFMIQKMSEESLFYSASDADTEGEEGKYFVYSFNELLEAGISEEEIRSLGANKIGNFERKNILRSYDLTVDTKEVLQRIRSQRKYPFIDKKIVVFQNAMMIKALFIMGKIDKKYLDLGVASLKKLTKEFYVEDLKRSKIGVNPAKIDGFLEDYGYLAEANLTAYIYTRDEEYLTQGKKLIKQAVEKFFDNGLWYFSKGDFPTQGDPYDNSYPSAVGVVLKVIKRLSTVDDSFVEIIEKTKRAYSQKISTAPFAATFFVKAVESEIIKVSGERELLENLENQLSPIELERLFFDITQERSFSLCNSNSCFFNSKDLSAVVSEIRSRV